MHINKTTPFLAKQELNEYGLFTKVEKCENITLARVEKVGSIYNNINDWVILLDDVMRPYFSNTATEQTTANRLKTEATPPAQRIKNAILALPQCERQHINALWDRLVQNRIKFMLDVAYGFNLR